MGSVPVLPRDNSNMIYYKNSPLERATGGYCASEVRVLTPDEINLLILERKITPINEIKYNKRSGRVSRPSNWKYYEW